MSRYLRYSKYVILAACILVPAYYAILRAYSIKISPETPAAVWVQSQNGNDSAADLALRVPEGAAGLRYSVDKYAEIGVIVLPDVDTPFRSLHDGRRFRDPATALFLEGRTIVDHNKTANMSGFINHWKVVSREDDNAVSIAVFSYDSLKGKYRLVSRSLPRLAQKGLNTFQENDPLRIEHGHVLGLISKKPVSVNKVLFNDLAEVITLPGFSETFCRSEAVEDSARGSFSFSALISAGSEQGELSVTGTEAFIKFPAAPVYGHSAWYKFVFTVDSGSVSLRPRLAPILLNANPFIGLVQDGGNPWTPKSFSWTLCILLALLCGCIAGLFSSRAREGYAVLIPVAGLLIVFVLSRSLGDVSPGAKFVSVFAAFAVVMLLPGALAARYYGPYLNERPEGRIVLAFVCSLLYWLFPAFGLFAVKTSYWPAIAGALFLFASVFLKRPKTIMPEINEPVVPLSWRALQLALWGLVAALAVHTMFASRFHADKFDTFHHISLAVKDSILPLIGGIHTNLSGVTVGSIAPYAYNLWGLLVGIVVKISGSDPGTVYCAGSALMVLMLFISCWWLLGFFTGSAEIKTAAFAIIILIYVTRTLATFAVVFQRPEFSFILYGPSVMEFWLYAVYIVVGVRAVNSRLPGDMLLFGGLGLAIAFFHLQFIFFNALVTGLLLVFSLRYNRRLCFCRTQVYLLAIIGAMGAAGLGVTSHLALGETVDPSSAWHSTYYALRYGELPLLKRFYPLLKDLLSFINSYIWNLLAVWGGLLLIVFPYKSIPVRFLNTGYLLMILMLLLSYNPITEMFSTPLITSWPIKRVEIYLRPLIFLFAALSVAGLSSHVYSFFRKQGKRLRFLPVVFSLLVLAGGLSFCRRWMPRITTIISTATYNNGNYLDVPFLANLPELEFLNEYSTGRRVTVLVEDPYSFALPAISGTYSFYHRHYPADEEIMKARENIWALCLRGWKNCSANVPEGSVVLVRRDNVDKFVKIGYRKLYSGKMFAVFGI